MTYELKKIDTWKNAFENKIYALKYISVLPYRENKIQHHTEIFSKKEVHRITLNQSSVTLHFRNSKIKLSVSNNFDLDPLIELVDSITGGGLQMIEHFGNFRDMKSFNKKEA